MLLQLSSAFAVSDKDMVFKTLVFLFKKPTVLYDINVLFAGFWLSSEF